MTRRRLTTCPALRALAALAAATAVTAVAAAGCAGRPAGPVASQVDALFLRFAAGTAPGCALAVVQDGRVALARGYGDADLSRRLPITPRTVFDIASTSKQFTAASVLLLAARGRLSLDDDVRKYVPEVPRHDATITLRHLLYHTSGLPNYVDLLAQQGKHYEEVTTDDDALAALAGAPELQFQPGTAFRYNDSGYFLLSLVVKRVSGQSLRRFAAQNLFQPLGMTDTLVLDDMSEVPGRAVPYVRAEDGGFRAARTSWLQTGDGGVNTTVLDLARWAAALDAPPAGARGVDRPMGSVDTFRHPPDPRFSPGDDRPVFDRALVAALMAPGQLAGGQPLEYAGGLFLDRFDGLRRVHHPGSWRGFASELMTLPERHLSVITLCNRDDADPAGLAEQVAHLYLERHP